MMFRFLWKKKKDLCWIVKDLSLISVNSVLFVFFDLLFLVCSRKVKGPSTLSGFRIFRSIFGIRMHCTGSFEGIGFLKLSKKDLKREFNSWYFDNWKLSSKVRDNQFWWLIKTRTKTISLHDRKNLCQFCFIKSML